MRPAPLLLALTMLLGCGNPLAPSDLNEWAAAHARWNARPLPDYEFEIAIACFCSPELNAGNRVSVRGGQVVEVRALASGESYPVSMLSYWPTIDGMFERVASAREWDGVNRITVTYDPTLGYPTFLDINYDRNIQDAGVVYQISNLQLVDDCGVPLGPPGSPIADWVPARCSQAPRLQRLPGLIL